MPFRITSYDRAQMENAQPIICPLWVDNEDRFRSRHYHAWDRSCGICGRKIVVSSAVKRQIESEAGSVIVCEQCALARSEALAVLATSESSTEPACPACATLKAQEEAAAAQLARVTGLSGSEEARREWAHVFTARWRHKFKAHNQEARGR